MSSTRRNHEHRRRHAIPDCEGVPAFGSYYIDVAEGTADPVIPPQGFIAFSEGDGVKPQQVRTVLENGIEIGKSAPQGNYRISVEFNIAASISTPLTLELIVNGAVPQTYEHKSSYTVMTDFTGTYKQSFFVRCPRSQNNLIQIKNIGDQPITLLALPNFDVTPRSINGSIKIERISVRV